MKSVSYYIKGVKHLYNYWVAKRDTLIASVPAFDIRLKVKTADYFGRKVYKSGNYEEELTSFLMEQFPFRDGDIFLDIGANMGWFSILLANRKDVRIDVHAFEPEVENLSFLHDNVELNGLSDRIHIVPKALSDLDGQKELYLYPGKNAGRHSMLPINKGKVHTVEVTTVDNYLTEQNIDPEHIRLIKIDVEGYELQVLKGGTRLLESSATILMEFSVEYMEKGNIDPVELIKLMEQYNYEPFTQVGMQLEPVTRSYLLDLPPAENIFWIKKGKVGNINSRN